MLKSAREGGRGALVLRDAGEGWGEHLLCPLANCHMIMHRPSPSAVQDYAPWICPTIRTSALPACRCCSRS